MSKSFVKSSILRSPHAFATRHGGVSRQDHTSSLNLAFGRGDDDATVLKNLGIFAEVVGFEADKVISLPQIHSDIVIKVSDADAGKGYFIRENIGSADGYVTDSKDVVLGIKTADFYVLFIVCCNNASKVFKDAIPTEIAVYKQF